MSLEHHSIARALRRTFITGAVVATTLVGGAAPAGAVKNGPSGDPQGFVRDTLDYALLYDDPGEGIVVTAGVRIEQFCFGDTATAPLRVFTDQNDTSTLKVRGEQDVPIFVYQFAGPGPALLGTACAALFDDDPATQPPEPWAEGSGLLKLTVTGTEGPNDPGGFHVANSVNGRVITVDGTHWKVKGNSSFDVDEVGVPIGDPADFQDASIHRIGPRS
jgi:hypothetical protein